MNTNNYNVQDLDKIRISRGNSNAVKRICWMSKIKEFASFLKNSDFFTRSKILTKIFENYSWNDYWDCQWNKTSWGWTTPKELTIYWEFREKYENFSSLSLDHWLMTYLPEFMEFIKEPQISNLSFLDARQAFSKKLGYQEVWRGMMLTQEELEYIEKSWINSNFVLKIPDFDEPEIQFEAQILSAYVNDLYERHIHNENHLSPFVSISYERDIAIAVWRHFWVKNDWRKFYLFKIKIPKIDLISYTEHAVKTPSIFDRVKNNLLSIIVDDRESAHKWDSNSTESYVFWKIDPEEIIEVTQPDIKKSAWNNKVTLD